MMSAAPYLPPAAAGSWVWTAVPPSTGSPTICHLIGREEPKRGPSQYVHLPSRVGRVPSMMTSAPGRGLAPRPVPARAGTEPRTENRNETSRRDELMGRENVRSLHRQRRRCGLGLDADDVVGGGGVAGVPPAVFVP